MLQGEKSDDIRNKTSYNKADEWIGTKLPQSLTVLLERARKAYLGEYHDDWSELDVEGDELVQFMRQSIEGMLEGVYKSK